MSFIGDIDTTGIIGGWTLVSEGYSTGVDGCPHSGVPGGGLAPLRSDFFEGGAGGSGDPRPANVVYVTKGSDVIWAGGVSR